MTAVLDLPRARARGLLARLEMPGLWIALWLQSGAVFPLLALSEEGLSDANRALLRMLALPAYGITGVMALRHASQVVMAMRRTLPLLALSMLPALSVLWSVNPSLSLRRTVALLASLLLSYVIAVRCTPRQLLWLVGGVLGFCMLLSLGLMVANPGMAFMPGEATLRGVYINKNVLGWAASLSTVTGVVILLDRAGRHRIAGLALFAVSAGCLVLSQSATGLTSTVIALMLAGFHVALARSARMWRAILVLIFLLAAVLLLVFLGTLLVPLLEALGKDATLTGRLPLWHEVDARIAQRPLLGYGYQTFWSPASGNAWEIWGTIGWGAPHSHNGYRDTLLSLGVPGLVMLLVVLVQALLRGARLNMARPRDGWLWPNVFLGQIMIVNMAETTLLIQNELQWILMSAIVVMVACRRSGTPAG